MRHLLLVACLGCAAGPAPDPAEFVGNWAFYTDYEYLPGCTGTAGSRFALLEDGTASWLYQLDWHNEEPDGSISDGCFTPFFLLHEEFFEGAWHLTHPGDRSHLVLTVEHHELSEYDLSNPEGPILTQSWRSSETGVHQFSVALVDRGGDEGTALWVNGWGVHERDAAPPTRGADTATQR